LAGTIYYFVIVADGNTFTVARSDERSFITNEEIVVEEKVSDLIAHWTFDEKEGTSFGDSSGNGSSGTLNNMEPSVAWVSGKILGALRFDGIDDYATIPHTNAINIGAVGESYSISFWFNRSGVPKFERFLIGKREGTGGPSPFEFLIDQGPYITFKITDGIKTPFIRPPKTISGNGWNQIVGVRNADTDKIYIYINGEEGVGTDTEKGLSVFDTTTLSIQNEHAIRINRTREPDGLFRYDRFNIDDVRIYNRALSESEIKVMYDALK